MFRRFFITLGSLGIYLVAFLLGLIGVLFWFNLSFRAPLDSKSKKTVNFEVQKGWDMEIISKKLKDQGLVRNWWSVYWLYRIRELNEEFAKSKREIVIGEYSLSPSYSPGDIINKLLSGKIELRKFSIKAGMSARELPTILGSVGLVLPDKVNQALRDPILMRQVGITHAMFPEGFILPGEYEFARPTTAHKVVASLVTQGKKKLDEQHKDWKTRAYELGLQPEEALTLASIIEKESTIDEERPMVSSMYHNRLRIGMPLQSNAALIYGMPAFDGTIGEEDLKTPGPYNTYLETGLPPTPICTASAKSIEAALHPADTDYLYFVDKGDGSHDFASTYKKYRELLENHLTADTAGK